MTECLGQLGGGIAYREPSFLERALDMHLPALIPEVPLDLAADARQGVTRKAGASSGIVVVDGLDQPDVSDLQQVLVRFWAVLEPPDTGPDQWPVPVHEHFTGRFPDRVFARKGLNEVEQARIVALLEFAGRGVSDGARFVDR